MNVAYFSPLNPIKSGISDYSEELIPVLSKYVDMDLFVDGYVPSNEDLCAHHRIMDCSRIPVETVLRDYDIVVYHMGNAECHEYIFRTMTECPGIVVMHDYSLHHFFAAVTFGRRDPEGYIAEMAYNYGQKGEALARRFIAGNLPPLWEASSMEFPLNRRVVRAAEGIVAHSDFVCRRILRDFSMKPVRKINQSYRMGQEDSSVSGGDLQIPPGQIVLASFGFVTPSKRIDRILQVMARLVKGYDVLFLIVGENGKDFDISPMVRDLGLSEHVRITGFVDMDLFEAYMSRTDIGINLRFPTQGETSASVCRFMTLGKPVLVSNVGWFSEIPDDCCIKIDVDGYEEEFLYEYLVALIENERFRKELGKRARAYMAEHHSLEVAARRYYDFFQFILERRFKTEPLRTVSCALHDLGIGADEDRILEDVAESLFELELGC